jgi:acyl carrier protein
VSDASAEVAIKNRLIEICEALGEDATDLGVDDLIPASGLIDSAGLLELIAWYEQHFNITLAQDEITIDNLGTIRQMVEFALARKT